MGRSVDSLRRVRPDHIFMVKATYWWSPYGYSLIESSSTSKTSGPDGLLPPGLSP